ncbi:MAG: QacE family quaternary ammonium compound efflux SMR transporter [Lautropia sp.]|nr:MAG: QacE family quaternary ammonium compound efflux SMR transporter [Pseudomonadota bacterium]MBC6960269.1 QacE family quaternary ammonium compound efflux SMR transporter [Lautropia sp.]MCL4702006.1 QacE family quaternary ammonium compound efflux SMR transporter [Burkholderiaceae bacterium]MCZ2415009.1 QacE family quaternary ammonium compound efflux SMR transporter [Burkholderiales bacterium]MDL1906104.1 QacE family quaternary ammonium compound efflux SMR transporter [Betaproteobacteria bac
MRPWIFLSVAIVSEVAATSALKASEGFSRFWPSLVVVVGYGLAFYFLSLTLRTIPVGVAYAIWSGAGVALVALIAWLFFGQALDAPAVLGLLLIVAGVVVLNVFSRTVSH